MGRKSATEQTSGSLTQLSCCRVDEERLLCGAQPTSGGSRSMRGFFTAAVFVFLLSLIACGGGSPSPTSPSPSPDPTPSGPTRIISISGSLVFGNVTVGQSRELSFTITNNGNSTLTVNYLSINSGFAAIYTS